jgi:protein-S-isoprenylcysteine O-methyltransferase Ste14
VVAGVVPWWLTRWNVAGTLPDWLATRALGVLMIVGGTAVLVHAFGRFVSEGLGTPAPVAPTERLVVGGLYRYVRNPMYLAVVSAIIGQAFVLRDAGLLRYAAITAIAFAIFVRLYEEPVLARRFGDDYATYRRNVPGWWPRLRAWAPPR